MYTLLRETRDPFVLTEQNIKKIVDIIDNRISIINAPEGGGDGFDLCYIIARLDNYSSETDSLECVFSEENRGNNRIVGLTIRNKGFYENNELNFEVEFNSCENHDEFRRGFDYFNSIKINVEGNQRDTVQLLFDDLNNYIQNSIVSAPNKKWINLLKGIQSKSTLLFSYVILLLLLNSSTYLQSITLSFQDNSKILSNNQLIHDAIASIDSEYKLNKLLELQIVEIPATHETLFSSITSNSVTLSITIGMIVYMTLQLLWLSDRIQKKFNSLLPFVFNFGTYPENYQYRIRTVKGIISSIGVIFLGLVGNLIYELLFKL